MVVTTSKYEIEMRRRQLGLTQADLASLLDISLSSYRRWLTDLSKISIEQYNNLIGTLETLEGETDA